MATPLGEAEAPQATLVFIALGSIGGFAIASWAYEHLFVEGLTDEERRGLLAGSVVTVMTYGMVKLFDSIEGP
jgi:hypothetical protein